MKRILSFIASCFLLSLLSAGATPTIPDTPAGRVFGNWLEAFNSGDSSLLAVHYQKHRVGKSADRDIQFRTMTGGFDLLSIDESQPQRLVFRVKERLRDMTAIGNLIVDDREPPQVSRFLLRRDPARVG